MREIKFRVWDKNNKKMIYGITNMRKIWDETIEDLLNNSMQYIGLKDKNNKEIFEGDIVIQEIWNGGNDYEEVSRTDIFKGIIIYEVNGFGIQTKGCKERETEISVLKNDKFITTKIIGNIYENKELVK